MRLHISAKVLIHVWSYDFYDMMLSTGKQRRHMINNLLVLTALYMQHLVISQTTMLEILYMGHNVRKCTFRKNFEY